MTEERDYSSKELDERTEEIFLPLDRTQGDVRNEFPHHWLCKYRGACIVGCPHHEGKPVPDADQGSWTREGDEKFPPHVD